MTPSTSPAPLHADTKRMELDIPVRTKRFHQQKLIMRGDLKSATGYGHETRALASLLRSRFEVFGVDLHQNPNDNGIPFPGRQVTDVEVAAMCVAGENPVVINNTPPEAFEYFHGATNIGAFYWETDRLSIPRHWPEKICAMDYMWAKSSFDRSLIEGCGFTRKVPIITWPFDFEDVHVQQAPGLQDIRVFMLDRMSARYAVESWSLSEVRRQARDLYLSVKSLAPRKGLPVLISEWRDYITGASTNDILLLKLRFLHNSSLGNDDKDYILGLIARAGFRPGEPVRIAFTTQDIPSEYLSKIYELADAYVTASYGEGFGGPLVEALRLHLPVIAGRHTGANDILAVDNPLTYQTEAKCVGLRGNSPIYPNSASWHLPVRGALAQTLRKFSIMSSEERAYATFVARRHAESFCSKTLVMAQIERFFDVVKTY